MKKIIFNTIFFSCLFTSFAQPKLVNTSLRAKQITSSSLNIEIQTENAAGYEVKFIPLKNTFDTLFFENSKFKRNHHIIQLKNLAPSAFYKGEFKIFDESEDTLYVQKNYASSSILPGEIIAYFNHEINEEVASSPSNVAHFVDNAMRDTLINYIGRAEESIDIAIYNSFGNNPSVGIAGAINQAHLDGVQVRVIHDGSTGSSMINVLNANIPVIARLENPNFPGIMHHKFLVMDAEHEDASKSEVWTGSTNWTTGQINSPDKNNVIIIQDQTLAQTYKMEFDEMWGSTGAQPDYQNIRFGNSKEDNTPKEFNVGGIEVECYFSPTDGTEQEIINLIQDAQESIVVASMLITRENLAQALVNQYTNGISELAFIVDTEDYAGSQKDFLANNLGATNYFEYSAPGIMHHKMMVVDHGTPQAATLTGSHNWSFSAENRNDENTLIIYDEAIANQYYQALSQLVTDVGGNLTNKEFKELNFTYFPNPVKDKLYISSENEILQVDIYDTSGKKVLCINKHTGLPQNFINLEAFQSGFYFVKLTTSIGNSNFKILKR